MKLKHAAPGSISVGTLETGALFNACIREFRGMVQENEQYLNAEDPRTWDYFRELIKACEVYENGDAYEPEINVAMCELMEELEQGLDFFAPEGHVFMMHPGDGADLGYWEIG